MLIWAASERYRKLEGAVAGGEGLLFRLRPGLAGVRLEVLTKGLRVYLYALARVSQQAFLPKVIHLERHDFARRADVLRNDLVSEWWDLDRSVFGASSEALGEAEKRANHAFRRLVEGETLEPLFVIEPAFDEHLQKRDAQ